MSSQGKALLTLNGIKAYQDAASIGRLVTPKYFKFSDKDYDFENENTRKLSDLGGIWLKQDISAYLPIDDNAVEYLCEVLQEKATKYCKICGIYLEDNTLMALAKPPFPFPPLMLQRLRVQIKYGDINELTNFSYFPSNELKQDQDRRDIRATMNQHIIIIQDALDTHNKMLSEKINRNGDTINGSLVVTDSIQCDSFKTSASDQLLPKGVIVMWAGSEVPGGWALCDGNNGAPDLRGRFVLGIGKGEGLTERKLKDMGGSERHTLNINEMPSHNHIGTALEAGNHRHSKTINNHQATTDGDGAIAWNNYDEQYYMSNSTVYTDNSGEHSQSLSINNSGVGQPHENMPPYYTLAYIIKL